jgi:hypothetical protein
MFREKNPFIDDIENEPMVIRYMDQIHRGGYEDEELMVKVIYTLKQKFM